MATKKQRKSKKQTKAENKVVDNPVVENTVTEVTPAVTATKTPKSQSKKKTPKVDIDANTSTEAKTKTKKKARKLTKKEEKEKKIAIYKDSPDTPPVDLTPESVQAVEDTKCVDNASKVTPTKPVKNRISSTGFGIMVKAKKKFSINGIAVVKNDTGRIFCKKKDGSSYTVDMQVCKEKSSEHRRMRLNAEEFNEFFRIAK